MIVHRQDWPVGYRTRLVPVIQGDFQVSTDPDTAFSTILGSCASVCLYDVDIGVGGMNHYLLAKTDGADRAHLKYGAHAMELLINNLLRQGANRYRLQAKVFGGSAMTGRFGRIGQTNTDFALNYLSNEGITVVGQDTGGSVARRVNFHPVTGKARVTHTNASEETISKAIRKTPTPALQSGGPVLF